MPDSWKITSKFFLFLWKPKSFSQHDSHNFVNNLPVIYKGLKSDNRYLLGLYNVSVGAIDGLQWVWKCCEIVKTGIATIHFQKHTRLVSFWFLSLYSLLLVLTFSTPKVPTCMATLCPQRNIANLYQISMMCQANCHFGMIVSTPSTTALYFVQNLWATQFWPLSHSQYLSFIISLCFWGPGNCQLRSK